MTTTVRASCPLHGNVELDPAQISLLLCEEDPDGSYYAFPCSHCTGAVRKPACGGVVSLLLSAGIRPRMFSLRPPLTRDELLTFHEQLQSSDHLAWYAVMGA